jgi:hypothetical protein
MGRPVLVFGVHGVETVSVLVCRYFENELCSPKSREAFRNIGILISDDIEVEMFSATPEYLKNTQVREYFAARN